MTKSGDAGEGLFRRFGGPGEDDGSSSPESAGPLHREPGAFGGDRADDRVPDRSLGVDEERGRGAEDAIRALDGAGRVEGDREAQPRLAGVLGDGGAPILYGDAHDAVAAPCPFRRQLLDHGHFLAAGIAPTGEEVDDQGPATKRVEGDRVAAVCDIAVGFRELSRDGSGATGGGGCIGVYSSAESVGD